MRTRDRAEYIAGLRALADLLAAHPELPLPYNGSSPYSSLAFIEIGDEARRGAAVFARVMPGPIEKSSTDTQVYLTTELYGLRLRWVAERSEMEMEAGDQ